eukprot:2318250-Prymnesium_polylepis.1
MVGASKWDTVHVDIPREGEQAAFVGTLPVTPQNKACQQKTRRSVPSDWSVNRDDGAVPSVGPECIGVGVHDDGTARRPQALQDGLPDEEAAAHALPATRHQLPLVLPLGRSHRVASQRRAAWEHAAHGAISRAIRSQEDDAVHLGRRLPIPRCQQGTRGLPD